MPEIGSQPNRPSSRRTSVGFGVGDAPGPQRKKLQLLPRSKHVGIGANKRIVEDVEEFFSARNIDESEEYFKKHSSGHHHRLVDKLVSKAIESKEADGKLVADAFARATEKNLCSISSFEEGVLAHRRASGRHCDRCPQGVPDYGHDDEGRWAG